MMRSFGSRSDCFVADEPLYAHYLLEYGTDHPGREVVLSAHETNAAKVIAWLTGEIPNGKTVFYQKQMAHHLIEDVPRDWLDQVENCFLIREPEDMLTSLLEFLPMPTALDTGLPQQNEIFRRVADTHGKTPPVVDARDVLLDPETTLRRLCVALDIPFEPAMLSWRAGRHDTDGAWAPFWYASVEKSTGFQSYTPKNERVPEQLLDVLDECNHYYRLLHEHRLAA